MMIHEVTYESDFTGETVKQKLYFNLRLSQLQHMINVEGWDKKLKWVGEEFDIQNMEHRRRIQEFWDDVIERSYGERDGDEFVQDPELTKKFLRSAAYDALIMDILYTEDSNVASEFIRRLFPKKLMEQIEERSAKDEGENSPSKD